MAKMALAFTSSGVESVALIDQEGLDALATWICYDKEYHYPIEQQRRANNPNGWNASAKAADAEFERQQKDNGGYCDICKDFAGQILSHFEIVRKQDSGQNV